MLKLTTNGNSLVVEGVGNGTFPMDGNCSYPMNSLIVQTDEASEMVTFRSASTNDVLFSGIIGEVTINGETVTKDTIVAKFDSVANHPAGGGGGGGTVDAYTKSESDAKFATKTELEATSTVANEADSKADAVTSRIEDVETAMDNKQDILVSGANIKTVNGQSLVGEGNVQINVPDAYTKAETDELLSSKENAGTAYTKAEANELLSAKEDKGTSYTKAQSDAKYALAGTSYTKGEEDNLLAGKENVGTSYTKAESDAKYLTEHQSLADYYNKTQTDNLLSSKEDKGTSYTKAESDGKYLTEHQSLADYYTKEQADGLLAGKANVGASYTKAESDEKYLTTHQDISGLATKEEVEAKQDKLVAGYGIGIDGNTIRVTLDGSLFVLVQTLPTEGINPDKIYVVPNSEGVEGNVATEYIYVNNKWEELGKFKADVDLSLYYTKGETDTLLSSKANTGVSYTKAEEDELLASKANSADVYTKQQADAKFLTEHQSLSDYATKAEVNSKQDTLVSGTNIKTVNGTSLLGNGDVAINVPDSYTKTETDNLLATKADTANVYTKQQADAKFLTEHQSLANYATKAELNNKADVGTSYTKVESDGKYATQQEADDMAADISALEADMQGKQATLVSGTNIKTVNGNSLLGEGDITIEGGSGGSEGTTYTLSDIDFYSPYNAVSGYNPKYIAKTANATFADVHIGDILVDKNGMKAKVIIEEQYYKGGFVFRDDGTRFVGVTSFFGDTYNFIAHNVMRMHTENSSQALQDNQIQAVSEAQVTKWDNTANLKNYYDYFVKAYDYTVNEDNVGGPSSTQRGFVYRDSYKSLSEHKVFDQNTMFKLGQSLDNAIEYTIGKGEGSGTIATLSSGGVSVVANPDGSWTIPTIDGYMDGNLWENTQVYVNGNLVKDQYLTSGMTWNVGDKIKLVNTNLFGQYLFSSWTVASNPPAISVTYYGMSDAGKENQLLNVYNGEEYLIRNEANEWVGTQAEYDAIAAKDNNIIYYIVEE